MIEQAYELTHSDGKTILVEVPRKGDHVSIYSLPLHFEKVLEGSHGGGCRPHIDIPGYIRLCRCGRMKLDSLITHTFGLDELNEATTLLRQGKAGRCLLSML